MKIEQPRFHVVAIYLMGVKFDYLQGLAWSNAWTV